MRAPLRHFNSIKVRLEPSGGCEGARRWLDFNSIKVRLELAACELPY